MFNYEAIDKTPTVLQIQSIINYMIDDPNVKYNFNDMMKMSRPKPNIIRLDLNNAHSGIIYEIIFNDNNEIESFKQTGMWMS